MALLGAFGFGAETMDPRQEVQGSFEVVYLLPFVKDLAILEGFFWVEYYPLQLLVTFHVFEVQMGHLSIYLHQNLAFCGSQWIDLMLIDLL